MKRKWIFIVIIFIGFFATIRCRQVDFTAPGGSILTMIAEPDWVPANGGVSTITVFGYRSTGAPLPDGTVIYFTTDLGKVVPERVETKDGKATVQFISDHRSGRATVQALSGKDAQASVEIAIGASAVSILEIAAYPDVLPREGGTTRIVVRALTEDGNPVKGIAIFISSDAGTLKSNGRYLYTNEKGRVEDKLTTNQTTVVTASAGTLTASITVSVGIDNQYPIASFEYSPINPCKGKKVFFNAWASDDPDGTIVRYQWDFGDGKKASGVTTDHAYKESGNFVVTLRVIDDDGYESATSRPITVTSICGESPFAFFTVSDDPPDGDGDGFLEEFELLTFDGSASYDPDGGAIVQYRWDFGDSGTATGPKPTHKYTAAGQYTVVLTVIDDENQTNTATQTITVVTSR